MDQLEDKGITLSRIPHLNISKVLLTIICLAVSLEIAWTIYDSVANPTATIYQLYPWYGKYVIVSGLLDLLAIYNMLRLKWGAVLAFAMLVVLNQLLFSMFGLWDLRMSALALIYVGACVYAVNNLRSYKSVA
ncbi:MAG: hypothetical protein WKF68_05490 [Daejeonella sp.]